jgi:hypothetical protein
MPKTSAHEMPGRLLGALAAATALLIFQPVGAQDAAVPPSEAPVSIDAAFEAYWAASSPAEAALSAEAILKTGVTFDDAFVRLKRGRTYTAQRTGIVPGTNRRDGLTYHYNVNVPVKYDSARRYQVRFQLHGGAVSRETNEPWGSPEIDLPGIDQIYVLPYSWRDAPWWSDRQVANLNAILDTLKRTYNVDENLVVISGDSDGGTGAYYIGMRETTRFASFLPLNGYLMVLASKGIDGRGLDDGAIFPNNLRNKPLFVVNGGKDHLYPTATVEPFVKHLMKRGVDTAYHPQPNGEHDTAWWPELRDTFEEFVATHPRDPHPVSLTWETRNLAKNRAHWLVIEELGDAEGEPASLPDPNLVEESDPVHTMVTGRDGAPIISSFTGPLFKRLGTSRYGRVDIVRKGNTFEAATKGVTAFTVLLSPDRFDFSKPMRVTANGKVVFQGQVERSLPTLLKWAANDNDRTMLYGAEVKVTLPRRRAEGALELPAN